jgi:hypothetical protein
MSEEGLELTWDMDFRMMCGSQVHFAMMFGMKPVGTIAHEWIMAVGAKQDYVDPNGTAMDLWEKGELRNATNLMSRQDESRLTIITLRSLPSISRISAAYDVDGHLHCGRLLP